MEQPGSLLKPLSFALAAMLAGCTLIPPYERPALPVPTAYPQEPAPTATDPDTQSQIAADIGWRDFFVDERLQKLIAMALDNNRNLRVAILNIEKSRAAYQIQRANSFPTVNAGATGTRSRVPANLSAAGSAVTGNEFTANVGISAFEIDLFGRVRSLNAQALETFLATEEARRATHISLVSQIASAYLTLASDLSNLQLAQRTFESQSETYRLTLSTYERGTASGLTLRQAQTSVETARYDVARFTSQIAVDRNALNLALGAVAPDNLLPSNLDDAAAAFGGLSAVPAGLPSDLMQRRPDVLEAEHTLKAANANIGAARAAFFPRIRLSSSFGGASTELGGLFSGAQRAWSFAASITLPIFDGGSNRATLESAKVGRDIAVAQYELAIQSAFSDVANALAQNATLGEQVAAQSALVDATAESFKLSEALYRGGINSYLDVQVAQRSLYTAQQTLISTQLSRVTNLVTLYQVLGGGWDERTLAAEKQVGP